MSHRRPLSSQLLFEPAQRGVLDLELFFQLTAAGQICLRACGRSRSFILDRVQLAQKLLILLQKLCVQHLPAAFPFVLVGCGGLFRFSRRLIQS